MTLERLAATIAFALGAALGLGPRAGALEPGDDAPAFQLPGSDGGTHALADFAGRQAVVLAWFPKAFTGG